MSWETIFAQLEAGTIRAAINQDGQWLANVEVKEAILEAFRDGYLIEQDGFVDKHNLMPQQFTPERGIRLVPGGSSVRRGSYVAPGVIIMPPAYVNVGAFVDEGTMVDSHALVGSCAQIGKSVHLSAGVQIGGVLEPIGMSPVVIEDHVFVGAGCVVVEGIVVRHGAVLAPGVTLSKALRIYDAVNEVVLEQGADVPENAVVVPGTRPIGERYGWAAEHNLQLSCPVIVKYRDEKSNSALSLEDALR